MSCKFDPSVYVNVPLGMFHCPLCFEMVLAGFAASAVNVTVGVQGERGDAGGDCESGTTRGRIATQAEMEDWVKLNIDIPDWITYCPPPRRIRLRTRVWRWVLRLIA